MEFFLEAKDGFIMGNNETLRTIGEGKNLQKYIPVDGVHACVGKYVIYLYKLILETGGEMHLSRELFIPVRYEYKQILYFTAMYISCLYCNIMYVKIVKFANFGHLG